MTEQHIIKRYERIGAWIGAILLGAFFVLISCLQPIDGVPGYQLITREDFSILFGFAFAGLVGGCVGAWLGIYLGQRFGRQVAPRVLAQPLPDVPFIKRLIPTTTSPAASPQRPSAAELQAEFGEVFLETTFEKTEELLARGESPTTPANREWLTRTCTDLTAARLQQRYGLTLAEVVQVAEAFARAQVN